MRKSKRSNIPRAADSRKTRPSGGGGRGKRTDQANPNKPERKRTPLERDDLERPVTGRTKPNRTRPARAKANATAPRKAEQADSRNRTKPVPRERPTQQSKRGQHGRDSTRDMKSVASGSPAEPMRIAKAMAHAGLCSRRDAERWIEAGRVVVNGQVITSPALEVSPKDKVDVDGHPLPSPEATRLWRYAKPKGFVTTHRDPQGRPTVFENLPDDMPRVVSIGRLDFNTEGLLLLTTNGELARHLELPATGWLRRYRVRAHGGVRQEQLDELKDGVSVDGVHYGPIEATIDSRQGRNVWLTIGLREGKNREVRKILASLGLEVNRLIRVSFGPFQLLDLKPGEVAQVRRSALRDQLGARLAGQFGLSDAEDGGDVMPKQDASKPAARKRPANRAAPQSTPRRNAHARNSAAAPTTNPKPRPSRTASVPTPPEIDESDVEPLTPWAQANEGNGRHAGRRKAQQSKSKTQQRAGRDDSGRQNSRSRKDGD